MANDVRTFNLQLDAFARKVGVSGTTVAKRVAFDLFGRIVRRTPVLTGRARASWTITTNGPGNGDTTPNITVQGPFSKAIVGRAIKVAVNAFQMQRLTALQVNQGDTIWISNNVPYIVALEEGHSRQAPAGMVALSVEEVNIKMSALVQQGIRDAGLSP
jgi:hypothetical protein